MSDRLSFTLHELVAEIDAYADTVLQAEFGVGYNHFQFLAILAGVEPTDMTRLAFCLGVTKAAVSKRVPALVADGWITADSPAGSGRSVLLSLTEKGAHLVQTAGARLERDFADMLAAPAFAADPIDVPRLNTQLNTLIAFIQSQPAAEAAPAPQE
ncbi:MarR family winged helix-turn-helix transcriptional regulator [Microbacterium sp. NPDC058389]|uniref:MarR family winged helix-turn-helix transcriptional regulator n=1 Tax=Microbacterium sp. NPDC058389 TaxID=3346475 RepID=UPI00365ABA2F